MVSELRCQHVGMVCAVVNGMRRAFVAAVAWVWSGWGAAAGLLVGVAVWEWAAGFYDPMILPTPGAALEALAQLHASGRLSEALTVTVLRALTGFGLAAVVGVGLGALAGLSPTASLWSRPYITVLLGTPPIAWLVLALLWFGAGHGTPVFTVFIACLPVLFAGAMQGTRTLDGALRSLAKAYRLPISMRLFDLYFPHMIAFLVPAMITALGVSWKVVIMAELLATSDGVGAELAATRTQLDTAGTLAWLVATVGLLLAIEYLVLEPIRRRTEAWRESE